MHSGDICVKYSLGQKTVCCFAQEVNDLYFVMPFRDNLLFLQRYFPCRLQTLFGRMGIDCIGLLYMYLVYYIVDIYSKIISNFYDLHSHYF